MLDSLDNAKQVLDPNPYLDLVKFSNLLDLLGLQIVGDTILSVKLF